MPLYEYICDSDGAVVELLRPMSQADDPVTDPEGRGRIFKRKHSTFSSSGSASGSSSLLGRNAGGCCPCGKNRGSCSA